MRSARATHRTFAPAPHGHCASPAWPSAGGGDDRTAAHHQHSRSGAWDQYRWYIVSAISLIAAQTALIAGLLLQRAGRRRAERALAGSEAQYRSVVETQSDLICRYLPDTTLTFVNDAYCRFWQKGRDQLIGRPFVELIPEPARDAALSHVASLITRPRVEWHEHEVLLPDGSIGCQQWIDHAVLDAQGRVVELQGIGRDVTEQRRAQESLRKSEAELRASYERTRISRAD